MFVSQEVFTEYTPIISRVGDSAKAIDGGSEIVGEGYVVQRYQVNGRECTITYTHALYIPALDANLISISAFDKAGLTTTFCYNFSLQFHLYFTFFIFDYLIPLNPGHESSYL
jgi:hypothetical protein